MLFRSPFPVPRSSFRLLLLREGTGARRGFAGTVLIFVAQIAAAQCNMPGKQCCADIDNDGSVTEDDLTIFYANADCTGSCCIADLDGDGDVDGDDEDILILELYSAAEPCEGYRPMPLRVWDIQCYTTCTDPDCSNNPSDPDACCESKCLACLAGKGCLPLTQRGVAFFDMNSDHWPDAAVKARDPYDPNLQRRVFWNDFGSATDGWIEGCILETHPADFTGGYSCTIGDVNGDGYADYISEPGGQLYFLLNKGESVPCESTGGCGPESGQCNGSSQANFVEVQDCYGIGNYYGIVETACLGDADGDGDVDLFLPAETAFGYDNAFCNNLLNDGTVCDPECDSDCTEVPRVYTFEELDIEDVGLENLSHYSEGAQFCDYDRDADLDLFFDARVRQNRSTADDDPNFVQLTTSDTGLSGSFDEGLLLCDMDMDGDFDVLIMPSFGNAASLRANRGDGTFGSGSGTLLSTFPSTDWGCSAVDWDNDGDIDLTTSGAFRRNTTVEHTLSGTPCSSLPDCFAFVTCFDDPNCDGLNQAEPSWCDVDRDGDLDCARPTHSSAVLQKLLENRLYGADCPEQLRRYVNVRPVRGAPDNGPEPNQRDYTESEFGAIVELVLRNNPVEGTEHLRRVQFAASSSGYINQNEYLLHFGLPPDPDPNDPNEDLRFDLYADFPGRENEANDPNSGAVWRVDWTVNSVLGDINLVDLYVDANDQETWGRPITIYRDGRVRLKTASGMQTLDPNDPNGARLYTLGGPLRLPAAGAGLASAGLTSGDKLAGLRFTKAADSAPLRIREIIVDAQLDQSAGSGCDYNVVVLDVTDPNSPQPIGRLKAYTFENNRRTFIPVPADSDPNDPNAFVLPTAGTTRTYDVRVRVTSYRMNTLTNFTALSSHLGVTVSGGLTLVDSSGNDICTKVMSVPLTGGSQTSPVKVRLSRKGN